MIKFLMLSRKKLITKILIPLGLLVLWFIFTIIFNSSAAFTVLSFPQSDGDVIDNNFEEIHKHEIISGEVLAKENNLGVISIRFNTYRRINNDEVKFRIRNNADKNWLYENVYRVDQFQPDDFFTFGFPIISDSKGKVYIFEIESLRGRSNDAVAISKITPQIVTKYQFSRAEMFSDPIIFLNFIFKKFINSFSTFDNFASSLVYLIPLGMYVLWMKLDFYPITKKSREKYFVSGLDLRARIFMYMLMLITLLDILLIHQFTNPIATFFIFTCWFLWLIFQKIESNFCLYLTISLLILSAVAYLFMNPHYAEKSAFWAYSFLSLGAILQFIEFKNKKRITVKAFEVMNGFFDDIQKLFRRKN